jgi:hypothetical protein
MQGRLILTLSAVMLTVAGSGALFAPKDVAIMLGGAPSVGSALAVQMLGGCFLGFAVLDWLSRRNRSTAR